VQHIYSRKTRPRTPRKFHAKSSAAGFTLVEILIVVVILGILAAIVVPQFVSAANESRDGALKMDLSRIRQQLEVYKQHHDGEMPTLANFAEQLTQASKADGTTAPPGTDGFPHGPYLLSVPKNPRNELSTVTNGAVGTSGWYYNEATGEFRANDSATSRKF
jgi:general secretion pathway protein G